MFDATEGGAFDWCGTWVEGIDLNNPAKAVHFIWIHIEVEARISHMPAITEAGLRAAIAIFERGRRACTVPAKVSLEIFFAGQVGAPRGISVGAVVERSEHRGARRISGGLQQRIAGRRTGKHHRRVAGDAAIIR